jgi:CHAT domain-containing protein
VALSACETGLGKVSRGDEVWGFTRSFLSAGAPSLLVSLWPVGDDATELLMTSMYSDLMRGGAPAAALRKAVDVVMSRPEFSDPMFWAAFSLVGDGRGPSKVN